MEPPWGVEPQTYALRVRASSAHRCAPSPSAHVTKHTMLIESHGTTAFEATKEAHDRDQRSRARSAHPMCTMQQEIVCITVLVGPSNTPGVRRVDVRATGRGSRGTPTWIG